MHQKHLLLIQKQVKTRRVLKVHEETLLLLQVHYPSYCTTTQGCYLHLYTHTHSHTYLYTNAHKLYADSLNCMFAGPGVHFLCNQTHMHSPCTHVIYHTYTFRHVYTCMHAYTLLYTGSHKSLNKSIFSPDQFSVVD